MGYYTENVAGGLQPGNGKDYAAYLAEQCPPSENNLANQDDTVRTTRAGAAYR
jgi:hypothetical protein